MPKNKIGGNKAKKNKNIIKDIKPLRFKEYDQTTNVFEMYGIVTKEVGCSRMEVFCDDNISRICKIKKTLTRKKQFIKTNDYVLVTSRNDHLGDIIHKYDHNEADKLYLYKELPENVKNKYRSLHTNENNNHSNNTINDIIFTENIDDNDIDNI